MPQCFSVPRFQCFCVSVFMSVFHCGSVVSVFECFGVSVFQCLCVSVVQCPVFQCFRVSVFQWVSVSVFQCFSVSGFVATVLVLGWYGSSSGSSSKAAKLQASKLPEIA